VTITDPLPTGLSFVSATPGQGNCGASGQTVKCNLGTLPAGGTALVTITANVAASAAGSTLKNTASASANEPIAQPELASSQASITPVAAPKPPPPEADLALVKTVNHSSGRTGEELTYTIKVTNHGPATATSPTVTDAFSSPVTFVSAHTSSGSCTHSNGHPTVCHLNSLPSGATTTITIVAKPTVIGQLRNSASVVSAIPDPNPANNSAHVTTNIKPGPAALRLTKSANLRQVRPGHAFSFTITVRSLGPEPALSVQVCDRLGSGMTYISADHATFSHGVPCWKISSLAKGKQRNYLVRVRAPMVNGPRRLTNVATAGADGVHTHTARATVELVGVVPPPPPTAVTG
jgi:uncharacterized repeat protein (TIGR01451 family)